MKFSLLLTNFSILANFHPASIKLPSSLVFIHPFYAFLGYHNFDLGVRINISSQTIEEKCKNNNNSSSTIPNYSTRYTKQIP